MSLAPAGGGLKRGAAGVAGELGVGSKATGAGDLGDQLGRGELAAAGQLKQRRGIGADPLADLKLKGALAAADLPDPREQLAGDPHLDGLLAPGQALGERATGPL